MNVGESWNEKCLSYISNLIIFVAGILQTIWYAFKFILHGYEAAVSEKNEGECAICFEKMITLGSPFPCYIVGHFQGSKRLLYFSKVIPEMESNHLFHESCLDLYFSRIPLDQPLKCPLCRNSLEDVREQTLEIFSQMTFSLMPYSIDGGRLESFSMRQSAWNNNVIGEQLLILAFCSRDSEVFMLNLPHFCELLWKYPQFFRVLFGIFDFSQADLSNFTACKLEFQQKFIQEAFDQGQLDLFCSLFDFFPSSSSCAESFLNEMICKNIENCLSEEYKLILLFERLSQKKLLQSKDKYFKLAVKAKNLSFLGKFLMFYDNYPDKYDKMLKPFFNSRETIISHLEREPDKFFELFFLYCLRQDNSEANTIMLIEGLKAKAFTQVYRLVQCPNIKSFSQEKEKLFDEVAFLLIQNPDFELSHKIIQNLEQKKCLYSVKKSTCSIL